jgi:hypothetical protein
VSKRNCTSRAEWRLQAGKPAEPLSAHYRLNCDYGTPVITCWEDGGSEPIYACESHAKQLARSRAGCPDVRIITAQSDQSDNSTKSENQSQIPEAAAIKPNGSASSHAGCSIVDTRVEAAIPYPSVMSPVRDLTYGNSAKAMVDEAIWNMATGSYRDYKTALQQGKSAAEAAQAAGGQLAVVHRKISDYTLKLEAVLSESKSIINVEDAIDKPLEQATLEIISNRAMSDLEKDAAIQQLGALQEWVKVKHDLQRDMTPLRAHRIILAIGDRVEWGRNSDATEQINAAHRALYCSLKAAILAAVPEAQKLHDQLANLYAAKSDLEIS